LELVALHKDPNVSNLFSARLPKGRVNVAFSNMPLCAAQLAQVCMVKHNATHKIARYFFQNFDFFSDWLDRSAFSE
jgi:hypothetical protein